MGINIANWASSGKTTMQDMVRLEKHFNTIMPKSYSKFMLETGPGEAELSKSYMVIWSIDDSIERNIGYEVEKYTPGFFLFGGTGGGAAFAYDLSDMKHPIYIVELISISRHDAQLVGVDIADLVDYLSGS